MKIRHNFVSNSSSSSTIVVVNPNYRVTENDLKQALGNLQYSDLDSAEEDAISKDVDILRKLNDYLDVLKGGDNVWEEILRREFNHHELIEVIPELSGVFVIGHADAGPDSGQIVGVPSIKIKHIAQHLP